MNKLSRITAVLSVLSVSIVLTGSGPLYAQGGLDDTHSTTGTTSTSPEPEHSTTTGTTAPSTTEQHSGSSRTVTRTHTPEHKEASKVETETENNQADDSDSKAELHKKGEGIVAEMRKKNDVKEKTDAERTKVCEAHKQGLQTKFTSIVTNSQRAQDRISGILDKAVAYQKTNNVTDVNIVSLATAAQTAKTASAASITVLESVNTTPDCNSASIATDVAAFKVGAQNARTNLKAYRSAVKALLQALEATKPVETTQGSN